MTRDGTTTPPWDLIRAFLALERHGSYEVAADMEGIDDSTLRRRIRVLEQRFGRTLFVRSGPAGKPRPTCTRWSALPSTWKRRRAASLRITRKARAWCASA